MDLTQKPFACTIDGCEMTFINEDHLNWHQKKHAMMLNLGLTNKNSEIADQTPTPTRFIRNCEEVGLFQDLQNMNPFEETFKKAVELTKNGSLHVPQQTNNDDTLHTPHIFPPVESNPEKIPNRNENQSNEFCFVSVPIQLTDDDDDFDDCDLTIITSGSDNEIENTTKNSPPQLKRKIKDLPQNKDKSNKPIEQPKKKPQLKETLKLKQNNVQKKSDSAKEERRRRNLDEKEKLREMNRAAQSRCRRKKQLQKRQMEDELMHLKGDNANLTLENQIFKHKFVTLKDLIIRARNTNIKYSDFLNELEVIVNSTAPLQNNAPILPKVSKEICKNPVIPVVQQPVAANPVLIQVLGSVEQLAVSVVPK